MKSHLLCTLITSVLCSVGTLYGQSLLETGPLLQEVLKLKPGQSVVYQPFKLQIGQTLDMTYMRFGDGSVKPGEKRTLQFVVYSATPDQGGQYEVLHVSTIPLERTSVPVQAFEPFVGTDETSRKGIIAVLVGLTAPIAQPTAVRPTVLPGKDAITAEVHGTGIGLLLPAVQKVREAAAR